MSQGRDQTKWHAQSKGEAPSQEPQGRGHRQPFQDDLRDPAVLVCEGYAKVSADSADIEAQLAALVGPGFATAAGASRLGDVARYLEAIERRIEKLRVDPVRDDGWTAQVRVAADEYAAEVAALPPGVEPGPELREIRWMIEELRVGLYAHPMRTRYPISIKRIQKAIDDLPRP